MTAPPPIRELKAFTEGRTDVQAVLQRAGRATFDLVLVDGDPSRNIGDLRHTRTVMMDGKLMDADALRAAGGFAGIPRYAE